MASRLGQCLLSVWTGEGAALFLVVRPVDRNFDAYLNCVRHEIPRTEPSFLRIPGPEHSKQSVYFCCNIARYSYERGPFKLPRLYSQSYSDRSTLESKYSGSRRR